MTADSHVKNERESEHTIDRNRFLIRNRGSCSSSSESTTTGNCEDDSNAIRQREIHRFARTFSLQEEQMPLAAPKEDLDVSRCNKLLTTKRFKYLFTNMQAEKTRPFGSGGRIRSSILRGGGISTFSKLGKC